MTPCRRACTLTTLGLMLGMALSPSGHAAGQINGPLPLPPAVSTAPLLESPGGGDLRSLPEDLKSRTGPIQGAPGLVPVVEAGDYALGPGDGLVLNIWGNVQAVYPLTVFGDGKIVIPSVGSLYVNGITLAEAQLLVADAVRRYYREAKTGLTLTALRSFEVQVIGQVRRPGVYLATSANRVLDLIAKAGGMTDYGSVRHVELQRHGRTSSLDLTDFQLRGAQDQNPTVMQGDVLLVPPKGNILVTVKSSSIRVNPAGPLTETPSRTIVELQEGERIADLLSMIGGLDPWWDSEKTFLERHDAAGSIIPVNPYRLVVLNDMSQNVPLKNGDTLTIPLMENRVYVIGEVKNTGSYLYLKDRHALDYVVQAGGGTQRANFNKAYVQRRDGTSVPLEKDPEVQVGDTIVVPEIAVKWWQDYLALAGFMAGLIWIPLFLLL